MTRILVTGGCGFLGSHLVEHFLKTTEAEIVILDKLSYASSGFDRLRDIEVHGDRGVHDHVRVKVLGCDLAQPVPEGIAAEIGAIDYVVHAAAETHVDNSIVDPLPFLQSNVIGTHHLLMFARTLKSLRRIFLVSTDEVYGPAKFGDDVVGFDEDAPFRPANPYAAAKAGSEAIGMAYANTYKLPVTIVNTMNLYGERQHPEKFIPLVIRRVFEGEKVLIHADPTKTRSGTRFYIHCRNFASALLFLIEQDRRCAFTCPHGSRCTLPADHLTDSRPHNHNHHDCDCNEPDTPRPMPLKIHVAGEREISNLDLAQMIAGFVGKPLHYELVDFHSSRPGHDLRYALDDTMIRKKGWHQPLDTLQSLERTVQWYLRDNNRRWLYLDQKGVKTP